MDTAGLLVFGAFSLLFLAIAAGLLRFAWRTRELRVASKKWPAADGKIIRADIRQWRSPKGHYVYAPDVAYEYTVDNDAFSGNRVSAGVNSGISTSRSPKAAQEAIERYPTGAEVKVFFDPEDHSNSMLEPGAGRGVGTVLFVIGIVFGLLGSCFAGGVVIGLLAS